ncbi:uncharacterized protein VTP21DRAFT_919 [Calcarisporiella thermophila]|uniref:uncharacterized protein n=1 Tax=Calcarisporiella thermophila TaxID=911321 RepID=UPI0037434AE0
MYGEPDPILLPIPFTSSHSYAQALIDFAQRYTHLITPHIVDFFTLPERSWELIDSTWREALESASNDDLLRMASQSECKDEWPESLKEFVKEAKMLSLPREKRSQEKDILKISDSIADFNPLCLHGMTSKKLHEVEIMSELIAKIAKEQGIRKVIDLGAGQGYLSRFLALRGLDVLAVDACEVQTCGAQKFQARLSKTLKGKSPPASASSTPTIEEEEALLAEFAAGRLRHITWKVTPQTAPDLLQEMQCGDDKAEEGWLVCGLHACGDLTPLMLRLFTQQSEIRCVVNVGCCYHFLTEKFETKKPGEDVSRGTDCFPMSEHLKSARVTLGRQARMLSCQTPWRWISQRDETLESFKHHFYRALLQYIMVEKGLCTPGEAPTIGRLRPRHFRNFRSYCEASLRRLRSRSLTTTPTLEQADEDIDEGGLAWKAGEELLHDCEKYHERFHPWGLRRVTVFWALRSILGPVLESLILLDRMLYLQEQGVQAQMWPLFDRVISPRNFVVVGIK